MLLVTALGSCADTVSSTASPDGTSPATALDPVGLPETAADAPTGGPPPPPSSAFIALLAPEQAAEIRALGVPLVVPTAIPTGFFVSQVNTLQEGQAVGYQVLYRDGGDRCFVVEYTSEGIGSTPTTESRLPIDAPLFNDGNEYGLNYGPYIDPNLRAEFPAPDLVSDWLPLETGAYRLAGAAYIGDQLTPGRPCQDIFPEEAVDILESSAVITEEITGDK